ncbi:MAG TPA: hypothetical protein VGE16_05290 [Albitalea sp.]
MSLPLTPRGLAIVCAGTLLSACAGVNFYADPGLQTRTGIPIHAAKPYLLVARTGAAEKPVEVSVVYLSDPQKVIYADPRSGFGSSNLKLSLSNGQLTEFGQEADNKGLELVQSLAGLITARTSVEKMSGAPAPAGAQAEPAFELYEIVQGAEGVVLRRLKPQ